MFGVTMFIKKVLQFIWNGFAVFGLLCFCLLTLFLFHKIDKYGYSPSEIVQKATNKVSFIAFGKEIKKQRIIENKKYIPLPLPQKADTFPYSPAKYSKRRILQVGAKRQLKTPSQAAKIAKDGDIIEIDAQEYFGDVALWTANNLHIRGVNGRPVLIANGKSYRGKAIWVTRCNNLIIENIAFIGTKVRDKNGAGIRVEGSNHTIRYCLFHDNENGILAGGRGIKNSRIQVEHSEFSYNGYDDGQGQAHGIYINQVKEFAFRYNYVHHTKSGHHVKSRSKHNEIMYNLLTDEKYGNSSYAIDIAEGGFAVIIGNVLQQSRDTENSSLIHYQSKTVKDRDKLFIVNNTVVSNRHTSIFVMNHSSIRPILINNLLSGDFKLSNHPIKDVSNISVRSNSFVNPEKYDYRLSKKSKAINAGFDLDSVTTFSLKPEFEYIHPLDKKGRVIQGGTDIGAFEYVN